MFGSLFRGRSGQETALSHATSWRLIHLLVIRSHHGICRQRLGRHTLGHDRRGCPLFASLRGATDPSRFRAAFRLHLLPKRLADLSAAMPMMDARGIGAVAIGNGTPLMAEARTDPQGRHSIYTDPSRDFPKAGMKRNFGLGLPPSNRDFGLGKQVIAKAVAGDPWQQGGCLLIGREGQVLAAERDQRGRPHRLSGHHPAGAGRCGRLGHGYLHTVLDKSIVFSIDRTGFKRHAKTFHTDDIPEHLGHRHIVVTGANSGIGFAAAEVWAARGARVTLVCRNAERGADAQAALRALSPSAHIELIVADLSELSAVATGPTGRTDSCPGAQCGQYGARIGLPGRIRDHYGPARHRAVCPDPGAAASPKPAPRKGVDASSLCPRGACTPSPSMAMPWRPRPSYDGTRHYAQTKRAQVVLAQALHAQVCSQGISAHAMHQAGWIPPLYVEPCRHFSK